MERAQGVDVNHFHPVTDWRALAASGMTIFGAKATNGKGVDRTFDMHREGARSTPSFELVVYYHFPTPRSSPVSQADHFVATVGKLRPNERLALDVEEWDGDPNTSTPPIQFVEEFFRETIRLVDDRRPLIYTSSRIWKMPRGIAGASWPSAVGTSLWAPRYGSLEPELPVDRSGLPIWPKWTLWQDSDSFACPGVDGPCDHNVFNGTVEELREYARLTA